MLYIQIIMLYFVTIKSNNMKNLINTIRNTDSRTVIGWSVSIGILVLCLTLVCIGDTSGLGAY